MQTIAIGVLPRLLTTLAEEHPHLRVEGHSIVAEDAPVAVSSGGLDLAVVPSYDTDPLRIPAGLRRESLFRDPVCLAVPPRHRLAAHRGPVRMTDLPRERWIAGEEKSDFGRLVVSLCHRAGLVPDIVHRSNDYAVVASLVAAGHGVAFIPAAADLSPWRIAVKTVQADGAGRDIVTLLRDGSLSRPTVQAVLAALRSTVPAATLTDG